MEKWFVDGYDGFNVRYYKIPINRPWLFDARTEDLSETFGGLIWTLAVF